MSHCGTDSPSCSTATLYRNAHLCVVELCNKIRRKEGRRGGIVIDISNLLGKDFL